MLSGFTAVVSNQIHILALAGMLLKNDDTQASEALSQPSEARASVLSMLSDSNYVARRKNHCLTMLVLLMFHPSN